MGAFFTLKSFIPLNSSEFYYQDERTELKPRAQIAQLVSCKAWDLNLRRTARVPAPDPNPGALLTVGSSPLSIFMVRSCSYASGKPSARIGGASGSETLTVRTKGETPGLRECRKRGPLPAWGHQERVHRRVVSIGCVQGRVSHPQRCGHLEPDDSSL